MQAMQCRKCNFVVVVVSRTVEGE